MRERCKESGDKEGETIRGALVGMQLYNGTAYNQTCNDHIPATTWTTRIWQTHRCTYAADVRANTRGLTHVCWCCCRVS